MNVDLDKVLEFIRARAAGRLNLAEEALAKQDGLPASVHQAEAGLHRHAATSLSMLADDLRFLAAQDLLR